MDLDTARRAFSKSLSLIDDCLERTVFDEWMFVSLVGLERTILHYSGPRPQTAEQQFAEDLRPLGRELVEHHHRVGNVDFAPDGNGPAFDVLITLGFGHFAILNDTRGSTSDLRLLPDWYTAEAELIRLGDVFLADPLAI